MDADKEWLAGDTKQEPTREDVSDLQLENKDLINIPTHFAILKDPEPTLIYKNYIGTHVNLTIYQTQKRSIIDVSLFVFDAIYTIVSANMSK